MSLAGAQPRGLLARLRHRAGPLLPRVLRRYAGRIVRRLELRRGAVYDVAGHHLRFLGGSEPIVVMRNTDERARIDAIQLTTFARLIQSGDVVADIGAHRGTYSVVAAACVGPHGHVYAFEPVAANVGVLARNLEINKLTDRVDIETCAVSDQSGVANFYAYGDSSSSSLVVAHEHAATLSVPTVSLDDYFASRTLPRVVKIDVEGAELAVLRGATRLLASDAEIICELHPYAWPALQHTADDLLAVLRQYNRYALDLETLQEKSGFGYGAVLLRKRS